MCLCGCVPSHVQSFVAPWTIDCQVPLSIEFSRQEYWNGLLFLPPGAVPNPGIELVSAALAGRFLTIEAPGKTYIYTYICTNTHRHTHTCAKLLQLCPTLCNPMDYSLPVSSVHGILQARILEGVDFHALLQGIFQTQGSNPHLLGLPHCRWILYQWATKEAPCKECLLAIV